MAPGSVVFIPPDHRVHQIIRWCGGVLWEAQTGFTRAALILAQINIVRTITESRGKGDPETGTNHLGFRCALDKAN